MTALKPQEAVQNNDGRENIASKTKCAQMGLKTMLKPHSKEEVSGDSQDFIQINKIIAGLILTNDGRYVKILEIKESDYKSKTNRQKNNIISAFQSFLLISPIRMQMQSISYMADINDHLLNLHKHRAAEKDAHVIMQSENLEEHILTLANSHTITKRYFLIYEYEGEENNKKSNDIEEIYQSMKDIEYSAISFFTAMGNTVVQYDSLEEDSKKTCDILYRFFNRRTSTQETLDERMLRIVSDHAKYNQNGRETEIDIADYMAPKGIKFVTSEIFIMGGLYHKFLIVKPDAHPYKVPAGWLDNFNQMPGVDINIYSIKQDTFSQQEKLKHTRRWKKARADDKEGKKEEQERILSEMKTTEYLQEGLKNGQELHDVVIMFTLFATSLKVLRTNVRQMTRMLKSSGIEVYSPSFDACKKALAMSAPLLMIDKDLFKENKHNYLTDSLSSLYMFIGSRIYNPEGFLLGINLSDNSLFLLDNFDRSIFKNANIAIFGTSGAGKTFLELFLGYHMRLNGVRVFYVLPEKGGFAKKPCELIGGSFISLGPNLNTCINIMEIRPSAEMDESLLEDVDFEKAPLLATKIESIKTFLQLCMGKNEMTLEEESQVDICLTNIYLRFGITNDDNSIYSDIHKKTLKPMPILSDLYKELLKHQLTKRIAIALNPFINGTSKNMNGQTNVDLNNKFIMFNVDKTVVGEKLQPVYMHIAYDFIYNACRESLLEEKAVFMDEVWRSMANESSAKQTRDMVKLIRGYGGSIITATQELNDYLGEKNKEYGQAIINNSNIKIFLHMEDEEIKLLKGAIDLTEEDKATIMGLQTGQGLFMSNGYKIKVLIKASQTEIDSFDNKKKVG